MNDVGDGMLVCTTSNIFVFVCFCFIYGRPVPRLRLLEWGESCFPLRLHGALLPFLRLLAALVFSHLSADAGARVGQGALALVVSEESFTWQSGKPRCVKFKVIGNLPFLCVHSEF